jgi:hypothetical protein
MNKTDIALLVVSCDAYSDLWEPAIDLIEEEWKDIPFEIYWGSNFKILNRADIKNISVGEDKSWCKNIDLMLDKIPTDYVIVLLEDFFLTDSPDNEAIMEIFACVKSKNIDCCRLIPNEGKRGKTIAQLNNIDLVEIPRNTPYRISTQIAIWQKKFLRTLLNPKFSAWEFEGVNSKIVDEFFFNICAVNKPVIFYKHAIERGKWLPQGIENVRSHNLKVDFDKRGYFKYEAELVHDRYSIVRSVLPEPFLHQLGRFKRYREYKWMNSRAKELNLIK